jgi:signal transduction histidine kinase
MPANSRDPDKVSEQVAGAQQRVEAMARQFLSSLCQSHELINDHVVLLTSILDSMNDGLVVVDSTNNLILTNRAAVRLAGIDPNAHWQTQLEADYQFYDGKTGSPLRFGEGIVAASLKDGKPREAEVFVRGSTLPARGIWFRLSTAPVLSQSGALQGAVTVFQDISDAKAALGKVKELYNSAPCGYHSLAANGVFAEINDTEIKWLGTNRDHLIGKAKFSDHLTTSSRSIFTKHFKTLAATGSIDNVELELIGAGGKIRNVLWSSLARIDDAGNLLSTRCTLFDVTERAQLRREFDALAALIAHDIKNHLVATAGVMELIREDPDCTIGDESSTVVNSLRLSNQDQLQALNNLINLWAAGAQTSPEAVDVSTLMREAADLVADVAQLRDVRTAMSIEANLPKVWAPQTALRHVLCNLLHNAIKFSKPSEAVQVNAYSENNGVTIVICDNGPGMSKKDLENLFKVRAEPKPKGFSSGLGLYLCHQIVEGSGGKIRCESEQGKGTRFFLHLNTKPPSDDHKGR